jgi:hypothetical protein
MHVYALTFSAYTSIASSDGDTRQKRRRFIRYLDPVAGVVCAQPEHAQPTQRCEDFMTSTNTYEARTTALLCIDFYNDFLSEAGKLWPWVKDSAGEVNLLDNLRSIVRAAREVGVTVYHVPHHRWEPGDYVNWKYPTPYQLAAAERQAFAKGTWGAPCMTTFRCSRAISWRRNTGPRAAFRTRILTISSSATGRKKSFWLAF